VPLGMLFEMDVGIVKVVEEYPEGLFSVVDLPGSRSSRPPRKVAEIGRVANTLVAARIIELIML